MQAVKPRRPSLAALTYRPLLLEELPREPAFVKSAVAGSVAVHVLLLIVLASVPREYMEPPTERPLPQRVTPLIDPPTRLTQRAPNKAPLSQEISAGMVAPAPKVEKAAPVQRRKFEPPPPRQVVSKDNPKPAVPQEPPRIESARPQQTVQLAPPTIVQPPPPTVQQPKLVLETPAAPPSATQGSGQLTNPAGGVQEAIRELAHSGSGAKGVGDDTNDYSSRDFNPTPSPTRPKSSLELLSDPKGVDFRPYLLQVLQNVRRNWFAVMPESARLGQRGRVVLQFAIAKDGKVTKVVFTTESGARALDRAAVAALSASDPLPQLPPEFKGDRVVLQFTFLYNAPR